MEIPRGIIAHHEGMCACFKFSVRVLTCVARKVELGLVIGKGGRDISQENADSHIAGYGELTV